MDDTQKIRTAIERNAKAVTLRPSLGQGTAKTVVRLKPGLECEIVEGAWTLTVGMTEKSGGTNAGPNPRGHIVADAQLAAAVVVGFDLPRFRVEPGVRGGRSQRD